MITFLTEHSCGPNCWEAREEVCRCSCGGRNHGCMRTGTGECPKRQAKIDGVLYELAEIEPNEMGAAHIIRDLRKDKGNDHWWYGSIREAGAEVRVKCASTGQMKWPELASYGSDMYHPSILWSRMDVTLPYGSHDSPDLAKDQGKGGKMV